MSKTDTAATFYRNYGGWLHRYAGGMPVGFMAAIAAWESGGKMDSPGDVDLGEYGFYQITDSFPRSVGVDPDVRKLPEGNIFLAGLEYNVYAERLKYDFPNLVAPGTQDQWFLSRLAFAIGYGGTSTLIRNAGRRYGYVWDDLRVYVLQTGGIPLGSQSATKIRDRVLAVATQWSIGSQVGPMMYGTPRKVPAYRPYVLPKYAQRLLDSQTQDAIVIAGVYAALLLG